MPAAFGQGIFLLPLDFDLHIVWVMAMPETGNFMRV